MVDWSESIWVIPLQQLKALYLHYHNAYGYQTWQGCDLPRGTPTHEITRLFDHIVLQDYVTN